MAEGCPNSEQLKAALRGRQSPEAEAALASHLADCPACQARLEALAGGSNWMEARTRTGPFPPPPAPEALLKALEALKTTAASPVPPSAMADPPRLDFLRSSGEPGVLGRFGPYEVLAIVAAGGMGIVLKARDPALNRVVALKILPPSRAASTLARTRFLREARAAAAVVHDHVVPIYAVDEWEGLPYLVMQFIKGRPLSERLRQTGPLSLEQVLRIGAQTAAGLAAAHAQGLIHRDVKPGNILLENSVERVKLTDFGLARVAAEDSRLTHEGHIAGTPEYMSPEQAQGRPLDPRSDLFSLGCVLYEMATGVSPFRADTPLASLRRVCDEHPPAAHTLHPALPEWLGQQIARLMAKDAAARPRSAEEVAVELERCLAAVQQTDNATRTVPAPAPAAVPARQRRNWPAWARMTLALFPILLGLAFLFSRKSGPGEEGGAPPPESQARSRPDLPGKALFYLQARENQPEQGFASLDEAIDAAWDGAAIECRFNGLQVVRGERRLDKALTLRATPGFEPSLMPRSRSELLLSTRAPLVLEGLTLLTGADRVPGARRVPRGAVGILVEGAPFLAAHCRFEIQDDSDSSPPPHPNSVRLLNVPSAVLRHCRFQCRTGIGLHWDSRTGPGATESPSQLQVQGCVAEGILVSTWNRVSRSIHVTQNTIAGDCLLLLAGSVAGPPLQLNASHNLFHVDYLVRRGDQARQDSTLSEMVRWTGRGNLYSVGTYAQSSDLMTRHEDWVAHRAITESNSLSAALDIKSRLRSLTERTAVAEAAAFNLTSEEQQRLESLGWTAAEFPGADPQNTGPGKPYEDWRASPAHQEWLALARRNLADRAAKP